MQGFRIYGSSTPRRCNGRVIVANKRLIKNRVVNSVKKLARREISSKKDRAYSLSTAQEKFRNMRLMEQYDIHDPKGHRWEVLPHLMVRAKVINIVATPDIVFALGHSGICAAFSRETNDRICFLNLSPDEVIVDLFYNQNNDSLVTISVHTSDPLGYLKCRSTTIQYIRRSQPEAGFSLFESQSLRPPDFVEFDQVNGKFHVYSAQDGVYKLFELTNYTMLYSISARDVKHVIINLGSMVLLLKSDSDNDYGTIKILSIEDGTVLKSFNNLLDWNKIDFVAQLNGKLFVKHEDENLEIVDIRSANQMEVNAIDFTTISSFIFLGEYMLLTASNGTISVWNKCGESVTSLEDHQLSDTDSTNHVTRDQGLVISYCKVESEDEGVEANAGSINISSILNGKCLAKITAENGCPEEGDSYTKMIGRSQTAVAVAKALEDITALFYDEERNEIYTGNGEGLLHVWST